jgi:hypothetical protein
LTVKLRSLVCRSVMRTDLPETSLLLDGCVPGRAAYREFMVWNRSEIPLQWTLMVAEVAARAPAGASTLEAVDMETGEIVTAGTVGGCARTHARAHDRTCAGWHRLTTEEYVCHRFGHARLRLVFKADAVGDYHYVAHLLNENDERNAILLTCVGWLWRRLCTQHLSRLRGRVGDRVHAVVAATQRDEQLQVVGPAALDFGDCYTGVPARQTITLRNGGDRALAVDLAADVPSQVYFELRADPVPVPSADAAAGDAGDGTTGTAVIATSGAADASEAAAERVDEVVLGPGGTRMVDVCYRAARDAADPPDKAARLQRRRFRVLLAYRPGDGGARTRRTLQAMARVRCPLPWPAPWVAAF